MPHDSTKADMWYHDTMSEFCFMVITPNLIIHMLNHPDKYSKDDIIDKCESMKVRYEKGKAMVYEQYLEMRRLEKEAEQW